jgi:uncharacterized membrane protein
VNGQRLLSKLIWVSLSVLVAIVVVFASIRVTIDLPNILSGTIPNESLFEYRYARYPWLAYTHIFPGLLYLLAAPLQLSRTFRNRHLGLHRQLGRLAIAAGAVSGTSAIVFGVWQPFGGLLEASATVVFGAYFIAALGVAYRAIRRRDVAAHRRWAIRAFAVGLAVGTIRIWIGLFEGFGIMSFREAFGVAFWLSFAMHAIAAEFYVRWRPRASGGSGLAHS